MKYECLTNIYIYIYIRLIRGQLIKGIANEPLKCCIIKPWIAYLKRPLLMNVNYKKINKD